MYGTLRIYTILPHVFIVVLLPCNSVHASFTECVRIIQRFLCGKIYYVVSAVASIRVTQSEQYISVPFLCNMLKRFDFQNTNYFNFADRPGHIRIESEIDKNF